jgi:hypothetical protein
MANARLDGRDRPHEVRMLWILLKTTSLQVATSARVPVCDRDGLHHPAGGDRPGRHHDLRIAAGARSRILIGVRHVHQARDTIEMAVQLMRAGIIIFRPGEAINLPSSLHGSMLSMLRHQCKQHRSGSVV